VAEYNIFNNDINLLAQIKDAFCFLGHDSKKSYKEKRVVMATIKKC
jgi:hypothetical protein